MAFTLGKSDSRSRVMTRPDRCDCFCTPGTTSGYGQSSLGNLRYCCCEIILHVRMKWRDERSLDSDVNELTIRSIEAW